MSRRVNVGNLENLENSLLSWIFEHLEEKSYMTDEVNQLPSSPFEESPIRDDSFDNKEDPEMATRTSFEKELNFMAQGDLDRLRETYSFSIRIQARIPEESRLYCLLA